MCAKWLLWGVVRVMGHRVTYLGFTIFAVVLFLMNCRRSAERVGRSAELLENLERENAIQKHMLEAAIRRPRCRDDLLERLREGGF